MGLLRPALSDLILLVHCMHHGGACLHSTPVPRNVDVPQFEKGGYSDHASYSLSKLLDIMFNAELARRAPEGVTCNSLDPGTVNTKMLRAGWGMGGIPVKR